MPIAETTRLDRRKARTRRQLHEALIALILERPYDEITIQDITDRADLSRATFYLHFTDKEDLLLKGLHEVFDQIAPNAGPFAPDGAQAEEPPSLIVFRHAEENRDLYRAMIMARSAGVFAGDIRGYLARRIREHYASRVDPEASGLPAEVSIDVLCQHVASSMLGLLTWWLETDAPYTAEQMARMYQELNSGIFRTALLP
jgi:AcrR family transcriptional regulator